MEQHNPDSQVEVIDDDEVPQQYRTDRNTSGGGRTRGSVRNNAHSSFRRKTRSTQSPQGAPVQESPGFFEAISRWVPMPQRFSPNAKDTRKQKGNVDTVVKIEVTQEWDRDIDQTQSFQNQMIELERGFQNTLQGKESEWMAIQQDLQRQLSQANRHAAENNRMFQARLHDIQLEKSALEEQHNAFIRKQQEASFRQMESARWHPVDETKVMSNLDMLKKDMRKWAKTASVKGISLLQSLGEVKHAALMEQLKNVAVIENGQLPEGITTTAKSPMLLLNALLADHVYASFFRSPFFFLGGNCENPLSKARPEAILEDIYRGAKDANEQDAQMWRSQTLRLLMPPLRNDISDGEKQLRHKTEEFIGRVAQQQASAFLASPASFLVENATAPDVIYKLNKIYDEAARQSYMLWTRRTEMRCRTLRDIGQPVFDAESPYFDPDSLMRHEDHEDQLKDRPVTVLVHPLLFVGGTDEAKDYDQERVWAKGIVWLDSRTT